MKGAKKSRSKPERMKFVSRGNRSRTRSNNSLSQLLLLGSYKKCVRHLSKKNRELAKALEESHIEAAYQSNLLKDYAKDSNQIMFARLKLNEMAKSMAKFVTDLEEVRNHLNIEFPSGINPYTKAGLNEKIAKVPAVNCIEEVSISFESETASPEKQIPTTSDIEMKSADEVSTKLSDERQPEVETSPVTFSNECTEVAPLLFIEDTEEKGKKSSSKSKRSKRSRDTEQLSLTPELDIGLTTIRRKRTSSRRMSQCSFPEPRSTRSREKAPSSENKLSNSETATPAMPKLSPLDQNLKKTEKNHEKSNESPYLEEVKLLESKSIVKTIQHSLIDENHVKPSISVAQTENQAEKNYSTSPPYIMPIDDNKTVILNEDMELTEVIPPIHSIIVHNGLPAAKPEITPPDPQIENNINLKNIIQPFTNIIIQNNVPVIIKPCSNSEVDCNNSKGNAKNEELNTELKSNNLADHSRSATVASSNMSQINSNNLCPKKPSAKLDKGLFDGESQKVALTEFRESEEIDKNIINCNFSSDILHDNSKKCSGKVVLFSTDESEDDTSFLINRISQKKSASNTSDKKLSGKALPVKESSTVQKASSKFEDTQFNSKIAKADSVISDSEENGKDNKDKMLSPKLRSSRSKKSVNYAFCFSPEDSVDDPSFSIKSKKKIPDNKKSSEKVALLNEPSPTIRKSFADFADKVSKDYSVYNLEVSNSEMEQKKKKAALRKLKISKQKKNISAAKPLSQNCSVTRVKAGNYKFSKVKSQNELGLILKQSLLKSNPNNSSPGGILKKRPSDFTHSSVEKEGMSNTKEDKTADLVQKTLLSKDVDSPDQSVLDTPKFDTKRVSFAPTDVICNFKRTSESRQIAESKKVRYTSKFALDFDESSSDLTPVTAEPNPDADVSFGSASDTELYTLPLPKIKQFLIPGTNNPQCNPPITKVPDKAKDTIIVEKNDQKSASQSLGNSKKIGKLSLKRNKSIQKELPSDVSDKINEINTLESESPKSFSKDITRKSLFKMSVVDEKINSVNQTFENPPKSSVLDVLKKNTNSDYQSLEIPTNPSLVIGSTDDTRSVHQPCKSPTNPLLDDLKENLGYIQTFENSSSPPQSLDKTKPNPAKTLTNPSSLHLNERLITVHQNFVSPSNSPQSPVKTKPNSTKRSEKKCSKKSSDENLVNKTNSKNSSKKSSSTKKPKSVKKHNEESPMKSLENSPALKDVLNIPDYLILPKRRSKPVSYKEPSLNKKMRRD